MMETLHVIVCALLFWLPGGLASTPEQGVACGECYRIDTPTLVGVVIGDIVLTGVIILVVYHCTKQSFQRRHNADDRKVYMNMPMNR
ncbi:hematopoietic cell signal transducer [Dendropsophus ebraccatus]|uniref:hematopoietic cell signal transducer n=1 Tax=Dendropsophus ebraccatus TaxID=150705 RepID=UPI003831D209